jgi:isoaspartyl peptidase/L-asparaginase-like protein (Ntn-hydrolase superfamily)
LNNDGEVECDAMIMDGHTLNTGICIDNIHKVEVIIVKLKANGVVNTRHRSGTVLTFF